MTMLNPDTTLAEIVNLQPSLARELEARGLDYCCGGAATLQDACAEHGLVVDTAIREFTVTMTDAQPAAWSTMGMAQLVDHLEVIHHAYLWAELPRLLTGERGDPTEPVWATSAAGSASGRDDRASGSAP
ncbi:MAG: DUF542 domain-containing protein [Ilumatobacter sp.]